MEAISSNPNSGMKSQGAFRHFSFVVAVAAFFCRPLSQRRAQKLSQDGLRFIEFIKEGLNAFVSTGSNVTATHGFSQVSTYQLPVASVANGQLRVLCDVARLVHC